MIKLVEWRAGLLAKGLKANAGIQLVVGGGGGGVESEFGAWPCGVYSKDIAANSLQSTLCMKCVYMSCGVVDSRQRVQHAYAITVRGDTPPSDMTGIVVDGEKYKMFDRVDDDDKYEYRTLLHGMSKQVNHILPDPHRQEPRGQHEAEH